MTACSLSEVLAEGVDCDRWVWWGSGLACIFVLGGVCCLLGFYWDFLFCHRSLRSGKPRRTTDGDRRAISQQASPEPDIPQVLFVETPHRQQECMGEYELVQGKPVNGHPCWHKRGGGRWLYSGFDGRWYICGPATKERNFDCASGYIYNNRFHKGLMPHQVGGIWEWSGGLQWHRDPNISIRLAPSPAMQTHVLSNESLLGAGGVSFLSRPPSAPNSATPSVSDSVGGTPRSLNGGGPKSDLSEGTRLSATQKAARKGWSIQNVVDMVRSVKRDSMSDVSTQEDNFLHLDSCEVNTEHSAGSSISTPTSGSVQAVPFPGQHASASSDTTSEGSRRSAYKDPAKILCVISPNGQRSCAGTYELVAGEKANGQPLWKMQGGERWLYSGTTGRWCIGGPDVKEDDFKRFAGFLSQAEPHKGAMPDRAHGIWRRWDTKSFVKDERITVIQLHGQQSQRPAPTSVEEARLLGMTLDLRGLTTSDLLQKKLEMDDVMTVVV